MKLSDHEQVVLKAIEHVAGSRNGLASVPAVTRAVSYPISTTNKILVALHRREIIALHHHDYPAQMTADEKKRAVKIGNDYFHAVAVRNPMKRGAAKKNPSPAQLKARAAFTRMAKARAKAAKKANPRKRRAANPRYLVSATDARGNIADLGVLVSPNKTQAVARAKKLYKGYKKFTAAMVDKGDYIGPKGVVKIRRKRPVKKTNPTAAMQYFLDELNEMDWRKPRIGRINSLIDAALDAGISPAKLKLQIGKQIGKANAIKIVNARIYARNPKRNGIAKTAGKAIKKVTRAVLGGVSKVAGKGAKALKNPRRRNAGAFDYYLGAIKKRSISPAQKEHFIQSIGWELSHRTPIQVQRELIKSGMTRKSAGAAVRRAQTIDRLDRQGVGDLRERAERKARGKDPRRKKTKKNPSASAIRKKFAGRVSGSRELYFPKGAPQGMAKLGRLVSIKLKGGKLIKPSRRNPSAEIWLCSDTSGKLWLGCTKVGPLYAGAPGDLGEMSMLEYSESKPHIGYPAQTIWFHKMGEVSGRRPHLIVNDDQDLLIKGGNYKITRAGIVD